MSATGAPALSRTDTAVRVISAGPGIRRADRLRCACRVATAGRMTGRFGHFDARPGGSYQLVVAYADVSAARESPPSTPTWSTPLGGHPSTPDHASAYGTVTPKDPGTVWNPGRLLMSAGRPERSAIRTEQQQGIKSRLPALVSQQQTEQMSAAALRPGRPSGTAAPVGS